jgi:hypothetical protein
LTSRTLLGGQRLPPWGQFSSLEWKESNNVPKPQDPLHKLIIMVSTLPLSEAEHYLSIARSVVAARKMGVKPLRQRVRTSTAAEVTQLAPPSTMVDGTPIRRTPLPPTPVLDPGLKRGRGRPVGAIDKAPRVRNRRSRAARPPAASREVDVPLPLPDPATDEPDQAAEGPWNG